MIKPGQLSEDDPRFKVLVWIGIIDQLTQTKANQLLRPCGLPMPQFTMLNHFSHHPENASTVHTLARALQQNQPATTKTVQKLVAKGLLEERPNPADGRSKLLYLTKAGASAHVAAIGELMPAIEPLFAGWSAADIDTLLDLLDRLKVFLDENR